MGEFADMANERWIDGDWEEDEEDETPFLNTKFCRFCGVGGLRWFPTDKGWRLGNASGLHVCEKFKSR